MYPSYQKLPLIPSRSAMTEMYNEGFDLFDVLKILKQGYDCSRSKRAENVIEKCVDKRNKIMRTVVVKSYNYSMDCEVWLITHFGITTKKR